MSDHHDPPSQAPRPTPASPLERYKAVDILRGFAVFGILVANMASYSGRSTTPDVFVDSLDQWIVNLSRFLVEAKFYSLFSLLFGWGMALQMGRARAKGVPFVPIYVLRMLALLLIGILHGILLWTGDILTLYAVLGLFLLLFRNLSPRAILVASAIFLVSRILVTLPGGLVQTVLQSYNDATSFLRSTTYAGALYATGSYWEVTRLRLQEFLAMNSWFLYFFGPVFSMFLLGLYVGKRRIVEEMDQHLPLIRRVMWAGLAIGLGFNALFVWSTNHTDALPAEYAQTVRVGARTIAAPAMMLFYACGILLLTRRQSWLRRLSPLANVGRMALSNYLLQSFLITLIFYGYGLGLYGQVDPSFGLLVSVLFFLMQLRWSAWWLERFQYGPAEWFWRLLTYGRRPPLRINEEADSLKPLPVIGP
ncbi:MAG TPA: DUF418 domain-containing protein, partial [Anaerolineales bacterium]|nr:DUF418 domain-containing protein [Anaerolineales bacterium]